MLPVGPAPARHTDARTFSALPEVNNDRCAGLFPVFVSFMLFMVETESESGSRAVAIVGVRCFFTMKSMKSMKKSLDGLDYKRAFPVVVVACRAGGGPGQYRHGHGSQNAAGPDQPGQFLAVRNPSEYHCGSGGSNTRGTALLGGVS